MTDSPPLDREAFRQILNEELAPLRRLLSDMERQLILDGPKRRSLADAPFPDAPLPQPSMESQIKVFHEELNRMWMRWAELTVRIEALEALEAKKRTDASSAGEST